MTSAGSDTVVGPGPESGTIYQTEPTASRSSSFIALLSAYEKPPQSDKDAGNKSTDHYKSRLPLWRFKLRNAMLPLVRWETPYLAALQTSLRHPLMDVYFALSANLGTHTFYVIMLPVSYWYGIGLMARDFTFILAMGVYVTGVIKDLLCLPRPLSPPLHRLTMSGSAALEYGFPSTHTANVIGVGMMLSTRLWASRADYGLKWFLLYQFLNGFFIFSIIVGRIYCGMHGFLDVISGVLIGLGSWWVRYMFGDAMNAFIADVDSYWPLIIIPVVLTLVRIHPEPADDCPCFDDGVAFLGVMMGENLGLWVYAKIMARRVPKLDCDVCIPYDFNTSGFLGSIARFVVGVSLVILWRHYMKRTLHEVLPPIFRYVEKVGLSMPRKFFIPASQYDDIPASIPDIPLFEAHEITSIFSKVGRARSDSVGPQSTADFYESMAYRKLQKEQAAKQSLSEHPPILFRGGQKGSPDQLSVDEDGVSSATSYALQQQEGDSEVSEREARELFSTVVVPRVRYDVEVVAKLIVYSGIGAITTLVVGVLFPLFGI